MLTSVQLRVQALTYSRRARKTPTGRLRAPVSGGTTRLGELIRSYRLAEGLTQAQLGSALGGLSALHVSKLETGRVATPPHEFLTALAVRTSQPVDRLLALGRQPAADVVEQSTRKFRLGFGHCLWGAPIFLAAHRGMLPDFEVASYSLRDPDNGRLQSAWIQPDEFAADAPGPLSSYAEPWSAVKILDMLEKEQIDVGVIPGNVILGRGAEQLFVRIGTVVDSATGCTFVSDARTFKREPCVLSTADLFGLVVEYARRKRSPVSIAAEIGTVADKYLQRSFEHAVDLASRATVPAADRALYAGLVPDAVRWHCESAGLALATFAQLRATCLRDRSTELLGVITWEPHASWLERDDPSEMPLKRFPLYFSPDANGRLSHMSFDVVTLRNAAFGDEFRLALTRLMQKIWQNAMLLSELDGTSFDLDPLRRVAFYFGFCGRSNGAPPDHTLARIRAAIDGIRYSTHWAMESHAFMQGPYE